MGIRQIRVLGMFNYMFVIYCLKKVRVFFSNSRAARVWLKEAVSVLGG